jgi:hypothetical protein
MQRPYRSRRRPAVSPSPGRGRLAPAFLILGVLILGGCSLGTSSDDKKHSSDASASRPAAGPGDATTPAVSPFERPLSLTPERTLTYATVRFAVTKAVISNRVHDDPRVEDKNPAVADVTLSVVNASKDVVRVESGQWQLRLGDGTVYKQSYSDRLEPRNTLERRISFPVPMAAQWTGASLTLDEKDKEPATMSLDGPVSPPSFTVQLATGGEATTTGPGMKFTILAGTEDLDGVGERAPLGKRYLHLSVHVTSNDAGSPDQFLPEFLRFSIDGAPYMPEHMSDNNVIASRSSQDVTMSLLIPATVARVELEVGKPDVQPTVKIPLDLKPVKAS